MAKIKGELNIANVIANPVLKGKNDDYMWTGMIKSKDITPYIIEDPEKREEFKALIEDFENTIKRYRVTYRANNNVLSLNKQNPYNDELGALYEHLTRVIGEIKLWLNNAKETGLDTEMIVIHLCRDYEEIVEKNPEELSHMEKEQRDKLKEISARFTSIEPAVREVYIPERNQYACYQFPTRGQEKKYKKEGISNSDKLVAVLENIAGKKDLTQEEGRKVLEELVQPMIIDDVYYIFESSQYAKSIGFAFFKNYLLLEGFSAQELQKMTGKQLAQHVTSSYNSEENLKIHAKLVSDTIINGINYVNIDKFLLMSMHRYLNVLDMAAPANKEPSEEVVGLSEIGKKVPEETQQIEQTTVEVLPLEIENENNLEEKETPLSGHIRKEESFEELKQRSKRIEYIIKKILETGVVSKKMKFNVGFANRIEEVSLRNLEGKMKKFCDGIYLTDLIKQNLKYAGYNLPDEMSTWSDELIERLELEDKDFGALAIVNFENLKRLHKLGKLNQETIRTLIMEASYAVEEPREVPDDENKELFEVVSHNLKNLVKNLYNEGIIDEAEIKECFVSGIFSTELLDTIEEGKTEAEIKEMHGKFRNEFDSEFILEVYRQYIEKYVEFINFQKQHPEKTEEAASLKNIVDGYRTDKEGCRDVFLRYRSDITEAEKHKLGDELLETYFIEMDIDDEQMLQETIKALYEDGLIDLENIINLDKKYIIPMLDTLSLEDTNKVRNSMNFEQLEELLNSIFDNKEFSDERKFIIVMNLLGEDTKQDKDAREFYLSLLKFDDTSEKKAKSKGMRRNIIDGGTKDSNKYIYPDFVKWKFYKALDKDVRVTRYANGFVEFASNKLGVRIIEKYYDGNRPAYGTATYILSEADYRKNQNDLVTLTPSGPIMEGAELRDITPRKDRVVHRTQSADRTWMHEMVKHFDIDYSREDTRYTKEELEALQKTVEKYKNEYEMIK